MKVLPWRYFSHQIFYYKCLWKRNLHLQNCWIFSFRIPRFTSLKFCLQQLWHVIISAMFFTFLTFFFLLTTWAISFPPVSINMLFMWIHLSSIQFSAKVYILLCQFFLLGLSYQTWIPFCEIFLKSKKRIIENNLLTSWQQYHYFTGGHICLGRLTVILFIKHLTPGFITSPKSYFLLSGKLNFNIKAL